MIYIELKKQSYQVLSVKLGTQNCEIKIEDNGDSVYLSLKMDDKTLVNSVICLNLVNIIRYKHLGFNGRLFFLDKQGDESPKCQQFNDRFLLCYEAENV